jgi:hypothetical protein
MLFDSNFISDLMFAYGQSDKKKGDVHNLLLVNQNHHCVVKS